MRHMTIRTQSRRHAETTEALAGRYFIFTLLFYQYEQSISSGAEPSSCLITERNSRSHTFKGADATRFLALPRNVAGDTQEVV